MNLPFFKSKEPKQKRSTILLSNDAGMIDLCCSGFTRLDKRPEIVAAARAIAEPIGSMTLHLMANTERGDVRIINELSRKIDIEPNADMTRSHFINAVVMNLLLYGHGNSIVVPHTAGGYLGSLEPIPADTVSFTAPQGGKGYRVNIGGVPHDPAELLHFVWNPDRTQLWKGQGVKVAVQDVADNLRQAAATEKGFMASKWKPSVVVKVDALVDEFSNAEGRRRLLEEYIDTTEAGEPWMVPAGTVDIETVRPLSLADLAINDTVELDKKTVASMFRVPPFLLGVGTFSASEWNSFVANTIRPIAQIIEQEMTRKLILSPRMYLRFNIASLYAYDVEKVADMYSNLYVRGIVTGNEVRDRLGMEPMDGLDDLVILENYIPLDKVGDQLKLKQEEN